MLRIVLIRPGSTDFDEQGRIKGTLDVPLSRNGTSQVARTVSELVELPIETIYASPCQPAQETAEAIAAASGAKVRRLDRLRNLDQGLWQGKLIAEVRQKQPKVYRQWQDRPETICPPGGEMLAAAEKRIREVMEKLIKKHKTGVVALVVPEPLASLVRRYLTDSELGDLWKVECEKGQWEPFEIERHSVVTQ